ncbi:MAG: HDIG domain-containing protein [Bacteroidetes bacterium]|nr:HDIG domain-containing protein [Bacteroidota bacterium]
MRRLLDYLRNKHALWFKVGVFSVSLFFIVWLLPGADAPLIKYEVGKPWMHENLVAPFDFAVYKSKAEITAEQQGVQAHAELYYRTNDSAFKQKTNAFFKNNKLNPAQKRIFETIFLALLNKKIIELPDSATYSANPKILIEKNKVVTEAYLQDFYTLAQADSFLEQTLKNNFDEHTAMQLTNLSEDYFVHTLQYNKNLTQQNLKQELNDIAFIKDKKIKGETIINRGDVVSLQSAAVLQSLQKELDKQSSQRSTSALALLGKTMYVFLCLLMVFLFLALFRKPIFAQNTHVVFIFLIICLFVVSSSLVSKSVYISLYVIPFAIAPVIIRTFFDTRTALFVHLNTVLICSLFFTQQKFNFLFIELFTGIAAIFSVAHLLRRSQLFITSIATLLISMGAFFALHASTIKDIDISWCYPFLFSSASLLLAYPLIYVFEKTFGFISDFTLLELNDVSSNPLLKQLSSHAPGTFQHSVQVANMAEEAVAIMGGKALLVRTGAMYHDIGKLYNPHFFTENQSSKTNPHEDLSYKESAQTIINHVIKGIEMAHQYKLPDQIIDFIRTHHGTTFVSYFYAKQIEENPSTKTEEINFKYPGPIPFSKETAVLMLADSVEASSRSLKKYDALNIDELVERIFKLKIDSNQLINSDITLKEISLLKKIFKKRLMNMYHVRIEYPSL